MKKLLVFLCATLLIFGVVTVASAVSVQVTYTADNVVDAWYQNGASPSDLTLGSNSGIWQQSDTLALDLLPGTQYQIVWQVHNWEFPAFPNTPAGFLAQIDLGSSLILSSSSWEVSHTPVLATSSYDFNNAGWEWHFATEYGTNSPVDPNIWDPVSEISGEAMWLWDGANFGGPDTPFYQEIFVRANFETAPVPEPATMLLLGSGLIGLGFLGRKKLFK